MKSPRITLGLELFLFLAAWLSVAAVAAAQSDVKSLIDQAYGKTKGASTVEQFTDIIDLCHQAQAANPKAAQSKYLERLLAWAHNKRGERYADQAARAAAADQ